MLRRVVESSELRSVGYKMESAVLEAEFRSGEPTTTLLLKAESIGRYFNAHVPSQYRFKKVR